MDNLNPAQRKAFQTHLNDLWDDYQDQLSDLIIEAKAMVPNSTYDEGEPVANARDMLADYARQANIISQDYYRNVRNAWAEATGVDLPAYQEAQVTSDRAAWQVFGGFNDTAFTGLKFTDVINHRARSGLTIDDLWAMKTKGYTDEQWAALAKDVINATSRLTAQFTAEKDPSKPKYARVPQGRTCAFCTMLASRGFAYWSEESAGGRGNSYHHDCDCRIVPSWGETHIEGYDPARLKAMYQAAKQAAGKGKGYKAVLEQMRRLNPGELTDGVMETTQPWPEDVVTPYAQVWDHIFSGHGPGTRVPKKTHFPDDWDEQKVKWAVKEAIAASDYSSATKDGACEYRYKIIEDVIVRVWLQKRRTSHGRWTVRTAYPLNENERQRLWQMIQSLRRQPDA